MVAAAWGGARTTALGAWSQRFKQPRRVAVTAGRPSGPGGKQETKSFTETRKRADTDARGTHNI